MVSGPGIALLARAGLLALLASIGSCQTEAPGAAPLPVTRIAQCPDGATLVGDAPPGGLRQRCQQDESRRHGASREWYASGRERTYTEWWEGAKHGRFALWYESGRLRGQGFHRHGVPAGEWVYYDQNGEVQQKRSFDIPPPPADWLAQAIAGKPPERASDASEPARASVTSGPAAQQAAGVAAEPVGAKRTRSP